MSHHNLDGGQRLNITSFQHTGLTVSYQWPSLLKVCMTLSGAMFSFLPRAGLFLLLALGFSTTNKLSLLLSSGFTSSAATLASKAVLFYQVFLPFLSPAFFWSSYNCWCCATNIEHYSSGEYFFNSIFPLKVPQLVLVLCLLAGLV